VDFVTVLPEPDRQTSQISRAEGRGFHNFGTNDRHSENVGLELHQQIIRRSAAIDS